MKNRNNRSQKFPNPSPWDDSIRDFFPQLPEPEVSVHFPWKNATTAFPTFSSGSIPAVLSQGLLPWLEHPFGWESPQDEEGEDFQEFFPEDSTAPIPPWKTKINQSFKNSRISTPFQREFQPLSHNLVLEPNPLSRERRINGNNLECWEWDLFSKGKVSLAVSRFRWEIPGAAPGPSGGSQDIGADRKHWKSRDTNPAMSGSLRFLLAFNSLRIQRLVGAPGNSQPWEGRERAEVGNAAPVSSKRIHQGDYSRFLLQIRTFPHSLPKLDPFTP